LILAILVIITKCLDGIDGVDTNDIVRVSSKQGGTNGGPCQQSAGRDLAMFGLFRAKSINNNLAFQIPNLDGTFRSGTQSTAGRKDQSIDGFTSIQRVQTLILIQVPQHGSVVLTTGGSKGTIRRDTDSVQVSSVSNQVVAMLVVGQVPDLDKLVVPSSGGAWQLPFLQTYTYSV
jgi:hypothetical protein